MSPLAEHKNLTLIHGVQGSPPPLVSADPGRLRQVINNLVSNAIKFTERGYVAITIELERGVVAIQIRDTGIGIPEDKINRVFHAFEQIDGSDQRQYGGTGLGLSISRRLSELMKGSLTAHNNTTAGSTFTIRIPCTKQVSTKKVSTAKVSLNNHLSRSKAYGLHV